MLSFEITSEGRLPFGIIHPNYAGPGDLIVRPDRDDPSAWQEKFFDFNWNVPEIENLEDRLKAIYAKLGKNYKFKSYLDPLRLLYSDKGIIVKEYGGENCTPDWLVTFELSSLLKPLISRIEQRRVRDFNTLILGNTLGSLEALNHKLKTTYKVDWTWFSFGPDYPKLKSADGDYDLDSESNIRRIAFDLSKTRVELVISYHDSIGAVVCALAVLNAGGVMIVKLGFGNHMASWLFILNGLFKELLIVKPESSDSGWMVGREYRGIKNELLEQLYTVLRFGRNLAIQPQLFKRADVPDTFITKLIDAQTNIINHRIEINERLLNNMEHYRNFTPTLIHEANQAEHTYNAKTWLETNKVFPLARNATISI
jgi:hypothetical protein